MRCQPPVDPIKIGMKPPHPGAFIREEILEPLSLSVTQAADALGVRRATLSDLLHAKAALSPEMALWVEKAFGVNMDTLLKMQAWFDNADVSITIIAASQNHHNR